MDSDGDKQIENIEEQEYKDEFLQRFVTCSLFIFQSLWIRCCTILFDGTYRKYLESQFNYVLYCGSFFWVLYFFIQIIK